MFSFITLPQLASYIDSICCLLWFCSGGVKSCFHKNGDGAKDARDISKTFDDENKDRIRYVYLKQENIDVIINEHPEKLHMLCLLFVSFIFFLLRIC